MKKIDKLILSSFLGPFFLTFLVVVFILLTQHMLKYFDDIVGKDLGWDVLAQLFFYFAVFMTPIAIPLAVLLSSLMTFGNLGEHFELTAIKSAGISLLRALLPIFVFVLGLTAFAFYSNNYFVPHAALEAYSLLYDIKQKKPALDLKEGAFYNGIPNFSIKVNKKHEDGQTIEDVIIYDHRNENGNRNITLADSGAMYTINNDTYLKLVLYRGHSYEEGSGAGKATKGANSKETFRRAQFDKSEFVLDLSSFGLDRTDKDLFKGNRIMRNLSQLTEDVDSTQGEIFKKKIQVFSDVPYAFYYHLRNDTLAMPDELVNYKNYTDSLDEVNEKLEIERRQKQDSLKKVEEAQAKAEKNKTEEQKKLKQKTNLPDTSKVNADKQNKSIPAKQLTEKKKSDDSEKRTDAKEIEKEILLKEKRAQRKAVPAPTKKSKQLMAEAKQKLNPSPTSRPKRVRQKPTSEVEEIKVETLEDRDLTVQKSAMDKTRTNNTSVQDEDEPRPVPGKKLETLTLADSVKEDTVKVTTTADVVQGLIEDSSEDERVLQSALNMVRQTKSKIENSNKRIDRLIYERNVFDIQWHKILSNSVACIIMFLIGAPLGAIIKRGGLGIPVLVSIIFFIIFYVMSMMGEKWAKQDLIDPVYGLWAANFILLPVGLFFLRQARNDARLFESDFYNVMIDRFKKWFGKRKKTRQDRG